MKKAATPKIVTRESLQKMLDDGDIAKVERVVGRALMAIFEYQTADEKQTNATKEHNNVGFSGPDAKSGSLTAKSFRRNGKLELWQIQKWTKKGENGYSRLTKYWNQLNHIAIAKAAKKGE